MTSPADSTEGALAKSATDGGGIAPSVRRVRCRELEVPRSSSQVRGGRCGCVWGGGGKGYWTVILDGGGYDVLQLGRREEKKETGNPLGWTSKAGHIGCCRLPSRSILHGKLLPGVLTKAEPVRWTRWYCTRMQFWGRMRDDDANGDSGDRRILGEV